MAKISSSNSLGIINRVVAGTIPKTFVSGWTNSLAGNPSLWGIYLAHIDSHQEGEKYTVGHRHYHVKCLYPILTAPKLEALDEKSVAIWLKDKLKNPSMASAKMDIKYAYYVNEGLLDNLAKDFCSRFSPARKVCKCVYVGEPHGIEFINTPSGKQWAIGGTNTQDRFKFCPWCGGTVALTQKEE